MLTTTFRKLREHDACVSRYRHLRASWSKEDRPTDNDPIPLLRILESNGLEDALWALRACEPKDMRDRVARRFSCDCAERVLPVFEKERPNDFRVRDCIDTARRYARGKATQDELVSARSVSALACEETSFYVSDLAFSAALSASYSAEPFWHTTCSSEVADEVSECAADASGDYAEEREWQEKRLRWYLSKSSTGNRRVRS